MNTKPYPPKNDELTLLAKQTVDGLSISELGLQISSAVDEQTTIQLVKGLSALDKFRAWALADLARHVLDSGFSNAADYLAQTTKNSKKYLRALAAVSRAFPDLKDRRRELEICHHQVVVENDPAIKCGDPLAWRKSANNWLEKAATNGWSCRELKEAMAGSKNRHRIGRDLGFFPRTLLGWKILVKLEAVLGKNVLPAAENEFLENVKHDLDGISNLITAHRGCCVPRQEAKVENHEPTEPVNLLNEALDEYLAGPRGQSQFNAVATKHNVSIKKLAQHRLQRGATMKTAGASFAEIVRLLGVKPEKLKKFMANAIQ